MKKIWLTTDGRPHDSVLAAFTTPERAERYRDLLVERYSLGKNLSLMGKPLARDAGTWALGLGPAVAERVVDENLDFLRGAWVVKVDERDRKSTRLNSSHLGISYAVFCLKTNNSNM